MLTVRNIMTPHPTCCTPDTDLETAARMMCNLDCGEIPVVEAKDNLKPVGVITDRDITCRSVAKGKNPLSMTVRKCMTTPCVATTLDASLEECCDILEFHQIRRLPVIDHNGKICGIVSQADIVRYAPREQSAELVQLISQGTL